MNETENAELIGLRNDINCLRDEFKAWREQVYEPGEVTRETARELAASGLKEQHNQEIQTEAGRWTANDLAHRQIITRLDSLNGFRAKIMGISQVLLFASPIAVAAWAILTR